MWGLVSEASPRRPMFHTVLAQRLPSHEAPDVLGFVLGSGAMGLEDLLWRRGFLSPASAPKPLQGPTARHGRGNAAPVVIRLSLINESASRFMSFVNS